MIAIGLVTEVEKTSSGIRLALDLRHFRDPESDAPIHATARWCPPYHGAGFGSWHLPDVGVDVLVAFPSPDPGGKAEDLDLGYAFAVISTDAEPPVDGLVAALSATRRVEKGKDGVAFDRHIRSDFDDKVEGKETRETVGVFKRVLRAAASWLGDSKLTLDAPTVELGAADAVKKIVHEEFLTLFNSHTHSGVQTGGGNTGAPNQQARVDTHTSTRARVDD
jgi:hypothetical protein